jgi:hypothetical protein
MPKKEGKKILTNRVPQKKDENYSNEILISNFVQFQKVMVELSEKFEKLSHQISELLNLFEESAKILVKKEFEIGKEKEGPNIELMSKIDRILDQNKIIAKGLTLIGDKPSEKNIYPTQIPLSINREDMRKFPLKKPEEKSFKFSATTENNKENSSPVFEIPD